MSTGCRAARKLGEYTVTRNPEYISEDDLIDCFNIVSCRLIFDDKILKNKRINQVAPGYYTEQQLRMNNLHAEISKLDEKIMEQKQELKMIRLMLSHAVKDKLIELNMIPTIVNNIIQKEREIRNIEWSRTCKVGDLKRIRDWKPQQRVKLLQAYDRHGANLEMISSIVGRTEVEAGVELLHIIDDYKRTDEVDLGVKRYED